MRDPLTIFLVALLFPAWMALLLGFLAAVGWRTANSLYDAARRKVSQRRARRRPAGITATAPQHIQHPNAWIPTDAWPGRPR